MNERNGNSVGCCSHDVARANSTPPDFRGRCAEKLLAKKLRDISRDFKKHNKADTVSLNPTDSDIPLKRNTEVWSVFHVTSNRSR